jgi:prepilin-type N-terminal cleavage/methylation domain-containing protein
VSTLAHEFIRSNIPWEAATVFLAWFMQRSTCRHLSSRYIGRANGVAHVGEPLRDPRPGVSKMRRYVYGFTLVELLVVIAIIGILVALLLPAIQAARESARRTQCISNLKQMGLAVLTHEDTKRLLPTGRDGTDSKSVSWAYLLLPYMEERTVFEAFHKGARVDDPVNSIAMRTPIELYACPSRRRAAADRNFDNDDQPPLVLAAASLGDYAADAGSDEDMGLDADQFVNGVLDKSIAGPIYTKSQLTPRQITDGLSNTLAIGERHIRPVPANTPPEMEHYETGDTAFLAGDCVQTVLAGADEGLASGPADKRDHIFGSLHPGVVEFAYLDGHVDSLNRDIDKKTLLALSTYAGGEVVQK